MNDWYLAMKFQALVAVAGHAGCPQRTGRRPARSGLTRRSARARHRSSGRSNFEDEPRSIPVVISEIDEQLVGQHDVVAGPSALRRERIDRAIALTEIHVWGGLHTQGRGEVIHRGVQVRDSCTTVPRIDARCTWRTAAITRIVVSRFVSPRLLILLPARDGTLTLQWVTSGELRLARSPGREKAVCSYDPSVLDEWVLHRRPEHDTSVRVRPRIALLCHEKRTYRLILEN